MRLDQNKCQMAKMFPGYKRSEICSMIENQTTQSKYKTMTHGQGKQKSLLDEIFTFSSLQYCQSSQGFIQSNRTDRQLKGNTYFEVFLTSTVAPYLTMVKTIKQEHKGILHHHCSSDLHVVTCCLHIRKSLSQHGSECCEHGLIPHNC